MKLVLFSDLHLDVAFAWMRTAQGVARKRRQALRDTLYKIIDLTLQVKADALLCGGDLYEHDRFTPDTAAFLKTAFERLQPIPVFIAPGNHDWYGPQSLYRRVEWSSNVRVFDGNRLQAVELDDGLILWGAAHRTPANTAGFLDDFKVDRQGVHLALFHGSERGWFSAQEKGKQLHAPFDAGQIKISGLHHVFLGHYHRPCDHEWFTYPGNPDPLTFGEDGLRGAIIVTVQQDGSVCREHIPVAVTEVHDLYVDVSGSASLQDIRNRVQERVNGLHGFARVTLDGELASDIDIRPSDIGTLQSSLDSLVIELGDLHVAYDFELVAQEQTVRGEFVREVLQQDLADDERRRILVTGLRALDGHDDLEVILGAH